MLERICGSSTKRSSLQYALRFPWILFEEWDDPSTIGDKIINFWIKRVTVVKLLHWIRCRAIFVWIQLELDLNENSQWINFLRICTTYILYASKRHPELVLPPNLYDLFQQDDCRDSGIVGIEYEPTSYIVLTWSHPLTPAPQHCWHDSATTVSWTRWCCSKCGTCFVVLSMFTSW